MSYELLQGMLQLSSKNKVIQPKGTVSVISSDPTWTMSDLQWYPGNL